MRRNNFWIATLVALVTFVSLSAFVHRPWAWHGYRHGRWGYDHCYYDDHHRHRSNDSLQQDINKVPVNDSTTY
jgi:hypothetical protein